MKVYSEMKVIGYFDGKYEFLSNFYPSTILYEHMRCATVEHGFQAMKALDPSVRMVIVSAKSPGAAKRLGRAAPLRPDWERVKQGVMLDLLRLKFLDPKLKRLLLDTGDAMLIEANTWHDRVWGRCICERCDGRGTNLLGLQLMQVRREYADG